MFRERRGSALALPTLLIEPVRRIFPNLPRERANFKRGVKYRTKAARRFAVPSHNILYLSASGSYLESAIALRASASVAAVLCSAASALRSSARSA